MSKNQVKKYSSFSELQKVTVKNPNAYTAGDGVDHIRISPYGETELGRWLSPEFTRKFTFPVIGEFSSVRNMWVWLTTEGHPDAVRFMPPKALEAVLRSSEVKRADTLSLFTAIIGYAKYIQLNKYKPQIKIVVGTLPLVSYSQNKSGFRSTMSYNCWYVEHVTEALAAVNENRKPVFLDANGEKINIEHYVNTQLMTDLFGERQEVVHQSEKPVEELQPENHHLNGGDEYVGVLGVEDAEESGIILEEGELMEERDELMDNAHLEDEGQEFVSIPLMPFVENTVAA